ncbi:hypothetical protein [Nonomuraea sp. CA-141351]|uniref:hypothetical protein n=1 Tax=Nonomuraea sp. CA-141351 TaxID=3239996 RepID=UPI003D9107D2
MSLSRRHLFQATGATAALTVVGQIAGTTPALAAVPWARSDIGVSAYEVDLGVYHRPPRHRRQRLAHHRRRAHVRERLQQQAEHFRAPNAIAAHLTGDTGEACNTCNMLKLTRANGGRVLGLAGTSQGAQVVLADDNGANNNLWRFL